jgi:hypothetical protein
MQRAGQRLPGPLAADRSVIILPSPSRRHPCAFCGFRNGRWRGRLSPSGYDGYRDGLSIGVVRALYSEFWSCSPCRGLSASSEL